MNKGLCNERLQDKDSYRRHFEEQHLALRRKVGGKYVPIETRISPCNPLDYSRFLINSRTSARRNQGLRETEGRGRGKADKDEKEGI
jgi:hypothetical protein